MIPSIQNKQAKTNKWMYLYVFISARGQDAHQFINAGFLRQVRIGKQRVVLFIILILINFKI